MKILKELDELDRKKSKAITEAAAPYNERINELNEKLKKNLVGRYFTLDCKDTVFHIIKINKSGTFDIIEVGDNYIRKREMTSLYGFFTHTVDEITKKEFDEMFENVLKILMNV